MDILKVMWISRKISGGLQFALKFWMPWDRILIGYAGADVESEQVADADAFKGSLFILCFELEFIRIRINPELWDETER